MYISKEYQPKWGLNLVDVPDIAFIHTPKMHPPTRTHACKHTHTHTHTHTHISTYLSIIIYNTIIC